IVRMDHPRAIDKTSGRILNIKLSGKRIGSAICEENDNAQARLTAGRYTAKLIPALIETFRSSGEARGTCSSDMVRDRSFVKPTAVGFNGVHHNGVARKHNQGNAITVS